MHDVKGSCGTVELEITSQWIFIGNENQTKLMNKTKEHYLYENTLQNLFHTGIGQVFSGSLTADILSSMGSSLQILFQI